VYLVSACLLGIKCRYDGGSKYSDNMAELAAGGKVIPACPEQLGGLPTPRNPSEISMGTGADVLDGKCRVITNTRTDVTEHFLKGARETLKLANACGVKKAVLKARSPSCGSGRIYDGSFSGSTIGGNGVTAELLLRNGIEVFTEESFKIEA
jgi:uncharacterized protein YbbK (DUF523 family)